MNMFLSDLSLVVLIVWGAWVVVKGFVVLGQWDVGGRLRALHRLAVLIVYQSPLLRKIAGWTLPVLVALILAKAF